MPLYPYSCAHHGDFEVIRPMAEVKDKEPCPECSAESPRKWTPPSVTIFEGQYVEALGAYVGSRAQEKEVIKKIHDKSGGNVAIEWH